MVLCVQSHRSRKSRDGVEENKENDKEANGIKDGDGDKVRSISLDFAL